MDTAYYIKTQIKNVLRCDGYRDLQIFKISFAIVYYAMLNISKAVQYLVLIEINGMDEMEMEVGSFLIYLIPKI